jgi:hypothetical protein
VLAIAGSSCKFVKDRVELLGTYVLTERDYTATLQLQDNGQYIQDVEFRSDSKRERFAGSWKYDAPRASVVLEGSLLVDEDVGSTEARPKRHQGVVILPAERWFGRIRLGSQEGPCYERKR